MKYPCLIALPVFFLVACRIEKKEVSEKSGLPEAVEKGEAVPEAAFDVKNASSLVGQKLEIVKPALEGAAIRYRVIELDGEAMTMTMDYSPDRLNFKVKDGVITEVSKG